MDWVARAESLLYDGEVIEADVGGPWWRRRDEPPRPRVHARP